jgi:hypothetical protein
MGNIFYSDTYASFIFGVDSLMFKFSLYHDKSGRAFLTQ